MTTFVLDTDMMSLLQRGDRDVAAHFDRQVRSMRYTAGKAV